ncbi:hypothetical protein N7497_001566 [Penicillium chrysogenum]|nr:hypothetical protein N7497_001566 [Penicillium chrysogenum]
MAPNSHLRHPVEAQGRFFEQLMPQLLKHDWSDATGSSTFIKRCFDAAKPAPFAIWTAPHCVSCHK